MDREITLRDYGRVLWSGRWIILATTAVAAVVGLLLTVVSTTTYTATARVYLGQPTSVTGVPISTPATNPATAPTFLKSERLIDKTAAQLDVSDGRVSSGIAISAPRAPGGSGNQPTLATITFKDRSRSVAIDGVNAYAENVLQQASETYTQVTRSYRSRLTRAQRDIARLERQIASYSAQLRDSSGNESVLLQALLQTAEDQLALAQVDATTQELNLAKAEQSERPDLFETADSATSTGSAPARLRTTVIAALLGLVVGIAITFIWRGSPAGRAGRA